MSPVTICLWFGSVNGDVVQLQDKLFILSKMSLVSNVFINSLWLNILDRIILVNVYTVEISKFNLKDVMLTNPCFCVFGDSFRVLQFYCTHFQAIFSFN